MPSYKEYVAFAKGELNEITMPVDTVKGIKFTAITDGFLFSMLGRSTVYEVNSSTYGRGTYIAGGGWGGYNSEVKKVTGPKPYGIDVAVRFLDSVMYARETGNYNNLAIYRNEVGEGIKHQFQGHLDSLRQALNTLSGITYTDVKGKNSTFWGIFDDASYGVEAQGTAPNIHLKANYRGATYYSPQKP